VGRRRFGGMMLGLTAQSYLPLLNHPARELQM
jgi:hypothetical protein